MKTEKKEKDIQETEVNVSPSEGKKEENPDNNSEEKKIPAGPEMVFKPVDPLDDIDARLKEIEEKRKTMLKASKQNKTRSLVNMIITVACICGGLILFVQTDNLLKGFGIGLLAAAVIFLIVMYFLTKNKYPNLVKEYIAFITNSYNSVIYGDKSFDGSEFCIEGKFDQADIVSDYVYKDISTFYSRNIVKGNFKNHSFKAAEISMHKVYTDEKKQQHKQVLFAGKYISIPNDIENLENRVIVTTCIDGETKYDVPNSVDDLEMVNEDGLTKIYAKSNVEARKLGSKFVPAVKQIKTGDALLNVTFVVWEGHTGVYLSYSNDVINVPFEHECKFEAIEGAKEQVEKALDAALLLKK